MASAISLPRDLTLPIHIATVRDANDQHDENLVLDSINDPVIADANTPELSTVPKFLRTSWIRVSLELDERS
jgi:hypothetical protein